MLNTQEMKYYSAVKMNEVLTHATAWMNLKYMLNEISQIERTHFRFHLSKVSIAGEFIETEIRLEVSGVEGSRMGNYCLTVIVST